ncbi:TPA: hypothetical protein QDZ42_003974 [Stenotrophomonas maltophilia]|nr:hypothetical protein [Stenotrophomonas maltophilia]HDS1045288.1 hypothetical protein [Stenotrophomonas maltophilia]
MCDTAIYDAFATLVGELAGAQGVAYSYPGQGLAPPTGEGASWLELQWLHNQTQNYGLGDDGPLLMQGFGQLSPGYRQGRGIMASTAVTDQIIDALQGCDLRRHAGGKEALDLQDHPRPGAPYAPGNHPLTGFVSG